MKQEIIVEDKKEQSNIVKNIFAVAIALGIISALVINHLSKNQEPTKTFKTKNNKDLSIISQIIANQDSKEIVNLTTEKLVTKAEYPKDNIKVKDWALSIYNEFASSSNRDLDEYDNKPYYWDSGYKVIDSSNYTSYVYGIYTFTGGAHGSMRNVSYIIDKKSNQRINNLEDMYNLEAYKFIQDYSRLDLKKQFMKIGAGDIADDKWLNEGTEANGTNYNVFWIDGNNLVVHFGQYQVGPYAIGVFDVSIPLRSLESFKK